ncbi:hypothetical protein JS756_00115 [Streptomyces actuosus]|uniref:Uncharacterized protein n=1 Tax=Streptomyces actuosus TaxID=1885 RepID=A0ABS2VHH5_STRAS|nr:hypothetical protein [Streptomyces actuosus]MBN0042541.1 hypothetical protein [Streptomyces actuosus]
MSENTHEQEPASETTAPAASSPSPEPSSDRRRWLRGRRGAALAGLLSGALLGAGTVAWQTDALPFVPRDLCWGTLSEDVAFGMFTRKGDLEARELPLEHARGNDTRIRGECRITRVEGGRRRWEVTAEVRDLDGLYGLDMRQWPDEFLSPRMAPLGGEITGMASPNRAWAALPKSCTGSSGRAHAPTVVDLSAGADRLEHDDDRTRRKAMARAVVSMTNALMERWGCSGRYAEPGEPAPLAERRGADPDELCGVKDLRLPDAARRAEEDEVSYFERVTPGPGDGVRSCDVSTHGDRPAVRLMTVEDPDLAQIFMPRTLQSGEHLKGGGYGVLGGDLSVFTSHCQTGDVAFVVRAFDTLDGDWPGTLLPAYVKSEARRIGCGEVSVTVPR